MEYYMNRCWLNNGCVSRLNIFLLLCRLLSLIVSIVV